MYSFERNSRVYLKADGSQSESGNASGGSSTTSTRCPTPGGSTRSKSPFADSTNTIRPGSKVRFVDEKCSQVPGRSQTHEHAKEVGELAGGPGAKRDGPAKVITSLSEKERVDKAVDDQTGHRIVQTYRVLTKQTQVIRGTDENLDEEKLKNINKYKELTSNLLKWIKDSVTKLEERKFPESIDQLKALKDANVQFKKVEVPPRQEEKEYLASIAREIYQFAEDVNVMIDRELHPKNVDLHWKRMMDAWAARCKDLDDAIARQERLKALLEKILGMITDCNGKLDKIEHDINEEERRIANLDPSKDDASRQFSPDKVLKLSENLAECGIQIDKIKSLAEEFISDAGRQHPDSVMLRDKIGALVDRYRRLQSKLAQLHDKFEALKARLDAIREAMRKFNLLLDKLLKDLDELENRLNSMAPVGKDVKTLTAQLNEMKDFFNRLSKVKADLDALDRLGEDMIAKDLVPNPRLLREQLKDCHTQYNRIEDKASKRLRDIEDALRQADAREAAETKLRLRLEKLKRRLDELEHELDTMAPVGNDLPTLLKQLKQMEDFQRKLTDVRYEVNNITEFGEQLIRDDMISDPRVLRKSLQECQDQLDRIEKKAAKRLQEIENALKRLERIKEETDKFNLLLDDLRRRLDELEHEFDSMKPVAADRPTLERQKKEMEDFINKLNAVEVDLNKIAQLGENLILNGLAADPRAIREGIKDCQVQLARLKERALKRMKDIEDALAKRDALDKQEAEFRDAAKKLANWLDNVKNILVEEENVMGDVDTITCLVEQNKAFQIELTAIQPSIQDIKNKERDLLAASPVNSSEIRQIAANILDKLREVEKAAREKTDKLKDAYLKGETFSKSCHLLLELLSQSEACLNKTEPLSLDENVCKLELKNLEKVVRKLASNLSSYEQNVELGRTILGRCHIDAEPVVKYWLNILTNRWEDINAIAKKQNARLQEHTKKLMENFETNNKLLFYLTELEARVTKIFLNLPQDPNQLQQILDDQQRLLGELRNKESDVTQIAKLFSIQAKCVSSSVVLQACATMKSKDKESSVIGLSYQESESNGAFATYKDQYPEVQQQKVRMMLNKWRTVWQLSLSIVHKLSLKLSSKSEKLQAVTGDKQRSEDEIIDGELERLSAGMKIYHVGDGKYRFGECQIFRQVKVRDGAVVVRSNGTWTPISEFVRRTNDSNKVSSDFSSSSHRSLRV